MEAYPAVHVLIDGKDLMTFEANEFPSRTGRDLRKEIFYRWHFYEMIGAEDSSNRKKAPKEHTKLFYC